MQEPKENAQDKGSETEKGLSEQQTSDKGLSESQTSESAASQEQSGVIDVSKEYVVDKKGTKLLGGDIRAAVGNRTRVPQLQAERDSARAELEKLTTEKAELAQKVQQMQKETEKKQMLDDLLEASGLKKQEKSSEDDFFTPADETPTIDPEKFSRQMETMVTKLLDDRLGDARKTIQQMNQEERERTRAEREQKDAVHTLLSNARQSLATQLKEELDLDDTSISRIIKLQEGAEGKKEEANLLMAAGKSDEAYEAWREAKAWEDTAIDLRAKALAGKRESDRAKELAEQLETGQFLNVEGEIEVPEEEKIDWTDKKLAGNKKQRKAEHLKQVEKLKQAAQTMGIPLDEVLRRIRK